MNKFSTASAWMQEAIMNYLATVYENNLAACLAEPPADPRVPATPLPTATATTAAARQPEATDGDSN